MKKIMIFKSVLLLQDSIHTLSKLPVFTIG